MKLNVALPSIIIKLDIAFTSVSTVEIVKAKPRITIMIDSISVCSFNNKVKNPKSALADESIENDTIPIKPIKNTIGTITKKEMINADFKVL